MHSYTILFQYNIYIYYCGPQKIYIHTYSIYIYIQTYTRCLDPYDADMQTWAQITGKHALIGSYWNAFEMVVTGWPRAKCIKCKTSQSPDRLDLITWESSTSVDSLDLLRSSRRKSTLPVQLGDCHSSLVSHSNGNLLLKSLVNEWGLARWRIWQKRYYPSPLTWDLGNCSSHSYIEHNYTILYST